MTEPQNPSSLASRLLQQEESLNPERYQEHRMQLEQQLARAERNIEITKWVVVAALLLSVAGMFVAGSQVFGPADPWEKGATILSVSIGALHIIAVIVFWLGLASYVSRFAPRARKLRENLQNDSIRELHREVAELRQMLAKREP